MYLDIETIPANKNQTEILQVLHQIKLAENKSDKSFETVVAESALSGAFGQIFCIGLAIDEGETQILQTNEKQMLTEFWEIAKNIDLFVGFNILDFDLRFIWQRSVINRVRPSIDIKFERFRNKPIYDIMYEWSHWSGGTGSRIGLDGLARALNIPSSKTDGISGKTVLKAYKSGRFKDICDYCARDVEVTRAVYKKLIFE